MRRMLSAVAIGMGLMFAGNVVAFAAEPPPAEKKDEKPAKKKKADKKADKEEKKDMPAK